VFDLRIDLLEKHSYLLLVTAVLTYDVETSHVISAPHADHYLKQNSL